MVIERVARYFRALEKKTAERGGGEESFCFDMICPPCCMGFVLKLLDCVSDHCIYDCRYMHVRLEVHAPYMEGTDNK